MQIFTVLIGLVLLGSFILPFFQQLGFIQDYLFVRKGIRILFIQSEKLDKSKLLLGIICVPLIFISLLFDGVNKVIFILLGFAYIIPPIMRVVIRNKSGLYMNGIIQTNEIILFKNIEKIIKKEDKIVFIDKKDGAKTLSIRDVAFDKIIELFSEKYKDIKIEKEEKIG